MKYLLALTLALLSSSALAADNYLFTPGTGATMRARDTTGSGGPLAPMTVLSDPSGNPIGGNFTNYGVSPGAVLSPYTNAAITNTPAVTQSGGPWSVSGTVTANQGAAGVAWPVTISGTPAVTVSSGTVAATQSGTWTGLRIVGNGGGTVDFLSTQNQTTPQAAWLVGGEFNTTPTTITSGKSSPFQLDANGNLLVNIKAGAAAGGTSATFGNPFPSAGTPAGGSDGTNFQPLRLSTWGTAPTGQLALAVNANVLNAATPGRTLNGTTGSGASPVVQPSAPNTATGGTAFPVLSSGATTVGVLIKNAAATLFSCQLGNTGTNAVAFVMVYNKATTPVVGTDTPVKILIVPSAAAAGNGGGSNMTFGPGGIALSNGFGIGITGAVTGSTAVPANQVVVNCDFE
jgi:hypothetical protein